MAHNTNSKPKRRGHKMWYTNIYSYIHVIVHVYQKYIGTSTYEGCATRSLYASSGPKAEGVRTNNPRGRGSGPWRLLGGIEKVRHIVPTALLVRVQRLRNDLYKAVKGPIKHKTYSPLDDRWVILTTSKAFHYFRARQDEIRLWPSLVCWRDHHRRLDELFL